MFSELQGVLPFAVTDPGKHTRCRVPLWMMWIHTLHLLWKWLTADNGGSWTGAVSAESMVTEKRTGPFQGQFWSWCSWRCFFHPWLYGQGLAFNFAQQNDHYTVETCNSDFNCVLIGTISKDANWCHMWLDHCSAGKLLICFPLLLYCWEFSPRWLTILTWSRIQRTKLIRAYHQTFYSEC